MAAAQTGPTERNIYVICTFNIGKETFNEVISIKTDLYFALGWVSFAASSILRYGDHISTGPYAHDISKQLTQFRLALELHFPFSTDPPLMEALLQKDSFVSTPKK